MRTHEVAIAVSRADLFLVLLRAPERGGYWHLVAGGVEDGESESEAAARELEEETGLRTTIVDLALDLGYDRPAGERVRLGMFAATAPVGWEPVLDDEHVEYRWLAEDDAVALLHYPEPRVAVAAAATLLRRTR